MNATIRNIGNSKGIILPKSILSQCGIGQEVTIEVHNQDIIIRAVKLPEQKRQGWEAAFKEMAENGDDALALPDIFNDENEGDWTWK